MTAEMKLIFAGTMGAGKTTAIRAISSIEPILTDVFNTDRREFDKNETTVGMEYGEIDLLNGDCLRLYGMPGQERFEFMWPIVARGALGAILLIDNSRRDPMADLRRYLQAFPELAAQGTLVVAVGRTETHARPSLEEYADELDRLDINVPVMPADVRRRDDVLAVVEVLFCLIETAEQSTAKHDAWTEFVNAMAVGE